MNRRVGSLFSGIGGLDLGLERAGFEIAFQVEKDDFAKKVLARHWPNVPQFGDVREFVADARLARRQRDSQSDDEPTVGISASRRDNLERLLALPDFDGLCGGPPCQPFSVAGNRKGHSDDRYLWPEMYEAICLFNPRWVLGQKRIASNANSSRLEIGAGEQRDSREKQSPAIGGDWRTTEPTVRRVDHGISQRVDRIRVIGNSVVPAIGEWIGNRIQEVVYGRD